jgi:hypothetical protein
MQTVILILLVAYCLPPVVAPLVLAAWLGVALVASK